MTTTMFSPPSLARLAPLAAALVLAGCMGTPLAPPPAHGGVAVPATFEAVDAAALMESRRITSVLVVDAAGRLCGALNSNDLMRAKVI